MTGIAALLMAAQAGWTWTLYDDGPIVLAREIPDTPRLQTTLECQPGAGVARLTLYGAELSPGFVTLVAADATATTEAVGEGGNLSAPLRLDHPVFAAFVGTGSVAVRSGANSRSVELAPAERGLLRRFAELCGG